MNIDEGTSVDLGFNVYNGLYGTFLTPDGDAVIDHNDGQIIRQPIDGSAPTVLVTDTGYASSFLLTPDGSQVVYQYNASGETSRLYRIPATGGTPVELPMYTSLSTTSISPDSSLLIDRDGWIIPLDDSGPVVNLYGGRVLSDVNLTSDMSRLIFTRSNKSYIIPTDGSSPETELQPSVSRTVPYYVTPDDQYAVIQETSGSLIRWHLSPLDGGASTQLGADITSSTWVPYVGVTSQGDLIYRAHLDGEDTPRIYSVPLTGGDATAISQPDMTMLYQAAAMSPNGDVVVYQAVNPDGRANLYAVSALGGDPVPLSEDFKENYQVKHWTQLWFSPDGKRLIYTINVTNTNACYAETYMTGIPLALIDAGTGATGSVVGGTGFLGGIDYLFDRVESTGTLRAEYFRTAEADLDPDLAAAIDFALTGETAQLWDMGFDGSFTGPITLTFTYDPALLGPDINEALLGIQHQLPDGSFVLLPVLDRDLDNNTITVSTDGFSSFVLCVVPEPGTLILLLPFNMLLAIRRRYEC